MNQFSGSYIFQQAKYVEFIIVVVFSVGLVGRTYNDITGAFIMNISLVSLGLLHLFIGFSAHKYLPKISKGLAGWTAFSGVAAAFMVTGILMKFNQLPFAGKILIYSLVPGLLGLSVVTIRTWKMEEYEAFFKRHSIRLLVIAGIAGGMYYRSSESIATIFDFSFR